VSEFLVDVVPTIATGLVPLLGITFLVILGLGIVHKI